MVERVPRFRSRRDALFGSVRAYNHPDKNNYSNDSNVATNSHGDSEMVVDQYVERIAAAWQNAVESIVETGRLLIQAKDELKHGEWGKIFEEKRLPFSQRTANDLMKIAQDPVLSNPQFIANLPPSWRTLRAIAGLGLPSEVLEDFISSRKITCETTFDKVKELANQIQEEGIYRWDDLRKAMTAIIRFMRRFPQPTADLAREVLCEYATVSGHVHGEDLNAMAQLPAWIEALCAAYEEWLAERGQEVKRANQEREEREVGQRRHEEDWDIC